MVQVRLFVCFWFNPGLLVFSISELIFFFLLWANCLQRDSHGPAECCESISLVPLSPAWPRGVPMALAKAKKITGKRLLSPHLPSPISGRPDIASMLKRFFGLRWIGFFQNCSQFSSLSERWAATEKEKKNRQLPTWTSCRENQLHLTILAVRRRIRIGSSAKHFSRQRSTQNYCRT